jgi:hypothetical protein
LGAAAEAMVSLPSGQPGRLPSLRPMAPPHLRHGEFEEEMEFAAGELEGNSAEAFYTRVQPVPHLPGYEEGHEILTRTAARGLLSGPGLNSLLLGVIRPDRGGASYWNFPRTVLHSFSPGAQRSHALRRAPSTSQGAALSEIRKHLATLYSLALRSPNRATALGWVGEALHLIQDSYSGAHTDRALGAGVGGRSPIRRIRVFYLSLWPPSRSTAPSEHNVPSDPRDSIWAAPGVLSRQALFAVRASRQYLAMLLRHLTRPSSPRNKAEFRAFLNRHFSF